MPEKEITTIQELAAALRERYDEAHKDVRGLKFDIRDLRQEMGAGFEAIRSDLVKHDERAEKMMEMLQGLVDLRRLEDKVERIRQFIREQHHVEV
jgi:predicted transcriptional regulator